MEQQKYAEFFRELHALVEKYGATQMVFLLVENNPLHCYTGYIMYKGYYFSPCLKQLAKLIEGYAEAAAFELNKLPTLHIIQDGYFDTPPDVII